MLVEVLNSAASYSSSVLDHGVANHGRRNARDLSPSYANAGDWLGDVDRIGIDDLEGLRILIDRAPADACPVFVAELESFVIGGGVAD